MIPVTQIPKRYIIDFREVLLSIEFKIIELGSVVLAKTAAIDIFGELLSCALGNANRDARVKATSAINRILDTESTRLDSIDMPDFVNDCINEIESNCLYIMRNDLVETPDIFNFEIDYTTQRAVITYEYRTMIKPQENPGVIYSRARDELVELVLNGTELPPNIKKIFQL